MSSFRIKSNKYFDSRSIFVNNIFKLIWKKNNGDFKKVVEEAKPFIEFIEENIRNVYELINTEIPLMAYIEYLDKDAMKNFDFTEDELKEKLTDAEKTCIIYYS
jgi:hypothetical protein